MNLFDQISEDIRLAMLARDKERLEALRNVKKVLLEAKTAKSGAEELSDDAAIKAIAKLAKQGRDSAEIYKRLANIVKRLNESVVTHLCKFAKFPSSKIGGLKWSEPHAVLIFFWLERWNGKSVVFKSHAQK